MNIFGYVICKREKFERLEKAADRGSFMRGNMNELHRWCSGEFQEIRYAVEWLWQSDRNHYRGLDDPAVRGYPHGISEFREFLRTSLNSTTEKVTK